MDAASALDPATQRRSRKIVPLLALTLESGRCWRWRLLRPDRSLAPAPERSLCQRSRPHGREPWHQI